MPKYNVTVRETVVSEYNVEIEADDIDDAFETAENSVAEGTLIPDNAETSYDTSATVVAES
jgi:hypothetical protein